MYTNNQEAVTMFRLIFVNNQGKNSSRSVKTESASMRSIAKFLLENKQGHVTMYNADSYEYFDYKNRPGE